MEDPQQYATRVHQTAHPATQRARNAIAPKTRPSAQGKTRLTPPSRPQAAPAAPPPPPLPAFAFSSTCSIRNPHKLAREVGGCTRKGELRARNMGVGELGEGKLGPARNAQGWRVSVTQSHRPGAMHVIGRSRRPRSLASCAGDRRSDRRDGLPGAREVRTRVSRTALLESLQADQFLCLATQ